MNRDEAKQDILRKLKDMVAKDLGQQNHFAKYARFNDCYEEDREASIEWLEMVLRKLECVSNGNHPRFGFLSHVGHLLDNWYCEYGSEHSIFDEKFVTLLYYKEYFVGDGTLAEHNIDNEYESIGTV